MARALNVYGRLLAVWSRGANRAPVATATAPAAAVPGVEAAVAAAAVPARRRRRRLDWVFVASVLLPTLLALFYYAHFASDVFISESRFVVRSPQRQAAPGLSALFSGVGISRSQDDTYSVHNYVLSRDALLEIDAQLKVRAAYSAVAIDGVNRFPGWLDWDASFESFYLYYLRHVSVAYDSVSSITTLQVRAYSAEQARAVNELLLHMGERLVNNLNDRSRQDLIQVAAREVAAAEDKAKEAALALSTFRSNGAVYDPDRQSALNLDTVARLREELRLTEAQIAQLRQVAPDNPQLTTLVAQSGRLRQSIAAETAGVLGGVRSLSAQAPAYSRLTLEREFADRQLASAMGSLEAARSEAARKQLYLERLVQPNLPDTAIEPRRVRGVATVFVLGLIAWGVLSLLLAATREHAD